MFLPLLLLCLLPSLASGLAGPARVRRRAQLLERASYLDNVPACALDCIEDFAATSFPGCTSNDLPCQCTSQSDTGFTLGEGALRCLIQYCASESRSTLESYYQICLGIRDAQPQTHATITASMQSPSTFEIPNSAAITDTASPTDAAATSEAAATTSSLHHSSTSETKSHHTSHTSTSQPTTLQTSAIPSFTPTPGVAQSAGAATPQVAPLGTGAIAGIVIAGLVILGVIIGLIACVCYSRRKKARASIASFGLARKASARDAAASPRTPRMGADDSPHDTPKPLGVLGIPANPAQKRWTLWRMAMKKNANNAAGYAPSTTEKYGPGFIGPTHESSPMSVKSYQTTSQLLPDKPTIAVPPFPPHLAKKVSERSLNGRPSADMPDRKPMPFDPFVDRPAPLNPRSRRATNQDLTPINTGNHGSVPATNASLMPGVYPPGPHPLQIRQQQPAASANQFAQTHVSPQSTSAYDDPITAAAIANRAAPSQFTKWKARPASNPRQRPLTQMTNGSDTSFEDDGDTPPETLGAVKTLSPVAESPARAAIRPRVGGGPPHHHHAPFSGQPVYYPSVPGVGASRKQLRVTMRDGGGGDDDYYNGSDASPARPPLPRRNQDRDLRQQFSQRGPVAYAPVSSNNEHLRYGAPGYGPRSELADTSPTGRGVGGNTRTAAQRQPGTSPNPNFSHPRPDYDAVRSQAQSSQGMPAYNPYSQHPQHPRHLQPPSQPLFFPPPPRPYQPQQGRR